MTPENLLKSLTKQAAQQAFQKGYAKGYEDAQRELLKLSQATAPHTPRSHKKVRPKTEVEAIRAEMLRLIREAGDPGISVKEFSQSFPSKPDYNLLYHLERSGKVSRIKGRIYLSKYRPLTQEPPSHAQV